MSVVILLLIIVIAAAAAIAVAFAVHRLTQHARRDKRRSAAQWESFTAVCGRGTIIGVQLLYRGADGPTYFDRETATTLSNREPDYQALIEAAEEEQQAKARRYNDQHYRPSMKVI